LRGFFSCHADTQLKWRIVNVAGVWLHLNPTIPKVSAMKASLIRQQFLDFFASKGHTVVASSPLVPGNDPTLMFTNSGMVQFKDVFLGSDKRPYVRAASVQACLRAGGKHNDLENVGYTARHHTFFEMLGNWSFGDYFKRDALKWSWELLTQVYKLPAEKLWATVYIDDDESYNIWTKDIGLPAERVVRIGDNKGAKYMSDNFWMMADTGPCGPCSEIFYDHGPHIAGGPPGSPEQDGDRYIEIWNNVFMQFDMQPDGTTRPLPAPCVDTGMGLERLAAILQHVHSNYEIDIFQGLIGAASRETGCKDMGNKSLRVIADHIRACAFLVSDGVIPGNAGRGYVLRRIVRRAIRHGYKLGQSKPFFYKLVPELVKQMGAAYPEFAKQQAAITEVLKLEEERFYDTLENGMELIESALLGTKRALYEIANTKNMRIAAQHHSFGSDGMNYSWGSLLSKNKDDAAVSLDVIVCDFAPYPDSFGAFNVAPSFKWHEAYKISNSAEISWLPNAITIDAPTHPLSGELAFKLHDTFGFPLDLTQDVCRERGLTVDEAGFDAAMEAQKAMGRAAGKFKMDRALEYTGAGNTFVGYEQLAQAATVLALYADGASVQQLSAGQDGVVVLDTTPFYAESGGQVGDEGVITAGANQFTVSDTQKIKADVFGHHGTLSAGSIKVGDKVQAQVNTAARGATIRNHSATHLMHKALREVLGTHVQQKGSLVNAELTRFDFAHNAPVTDAQIAAIEQQVNAEIVANAAATARLMDMDAAKATGAMMLFGEKYGETVRVLNIGSSVELCGGVHVQRTGDIGLFKIISEGGVAAGVRRIEAVTGLNALNHVQHLSATLGRVADSVHASGQDVLGKIHALQEQLKTTEKELATAKSKLAATAGASLAESAVMVAGVKVLAAQMDGADAKALRETLDQLKNKLGSAVIVLGSVADGKVQLAAGVTADLLARFKAGELVNFVAQQVGGKGGGKPDTAMAGGTDAAALPAALASVAGWVVA
jgi:alanyl-tRNA synthetase